MIDTHCHLTDTRLHSQLEFVVTRAMFAGYYGAYAMGSLEDRCFVVEPP